MSESEIIYLDNAATTALDEEVKEVMLQSFEQFGNPSSVHSRGREAKASLEKARRNIAEQLSVTPSQLYFTSGATEAINTGIFSTLYSNPKINSIITSEIEHDAVVETTKKCSGLFSKKRLAVQILPNGHIDMDHFNTLIKSHPNALVCLMHANNEIGNLSNIDEIGQLCLEHGSIYFCDMVQTIGHMDLDIGSLPLHMACCSPHKMHGPKGVGFLIIKDMKIEPRLFGGSQEMKMRAGTENMTGITGMEKALEVALRGLKKDQKHIEGLRTQMMKGLKEKVENEISFYGDTTNSLYTILNVKLPVEIDSEIVVYSLDIEKICVSSGSACTSGSNKGSHVIEVLKNKEDHCANVRLSFSKYNRAQDIEKCVEKIAAICDKY